MPVATAMSSEGIRAIELPRDGLGEHAWKP
jgi:hypothetical protein